ncbi:hypothetical protein H4R35_000842 [Dimargaris xerosporica]|nr:hypothetical protein H4R35_000842 [Dimargaris xerosporica]
MTKVESPWRLRAPPPDRTAASPASADSHNAFYEAEFDRLAQQLMTEYVMVLVPPGAKPASNALEEPVPGTKVYRVVECEFYVQDNANLTYELANAPRLDDTASKLPSYDKPKTALIQCGLVDPFAHGHHVQCQPGLFYFHHVGQSNGYREGTRRGLDITLGYNAPTLDKTIGAYSHPILAQRQGMQGQVRAGVLIRSIQDVAVGTLVSGPCLLVNTVLDHLAVQKIAQLVNSHFHGNLEADRAKLSAKMAAQRGWYFQRLTPALHRQLAAITKPYTLPRSPYFTEPAASQWFKPLRTPRVGLGFNTKKYQLDAQLLFWPKLYRYVHPDIRFTDLAKGRHYTIIGYLHVLLVQLAQGLDMTKTFHDAVWWWALGFHPTHQHQTAESIVAHKRYCDQYCHDCHTVPHQPLTFLLDTTAWERFDTWCRDHPSPPDLPWNEWSRTTGVPATQLARAMDGIRRGSEQLYTTFLHQKVSGHAQVYQYFGACCRYAFTKYWVRSNCVS